jgi:phospholipase D1/2
VSRLLSRVPRVAVQCGYIRRREFVIGTAIGIAPGIALTVMFLDRADAAINDPSASTFTLLAACTALFVGSAVYVWRRFGRDASGQRIA